MRDRNVIKFPYQRSQRRYRQLDYLEAEKQLKKGNRVNFLKFCGLMILLTVVVAAIFVVTAKASETLTPVIVEWVNNLTQ